MESSPDIEGGNPSAAAPSIQRLTAIALVEWVGRDGRVLRTQPVYAWPVTIGRALSCDVVLDDSHVAPEHASLDLHGGSLLVRIGQTINGAAINHHHVLAGSQAALPAGDVLRLGTTRLRVRLASDQLAPEQPLTQHILLQAIPHPVAPARWVLLAGLFLALALAIIAEQWLDSDPDTSASTYLSRLLAVGGVVAIWTLLWALASKLFHGSLDYMAHLRRALSYSLAWSALGLALPAAAFMTGWPWLSRVADAGGSALICALLLAHLTLVLPSQRRALMAGFASLYLAGVGLNLWLNEQHQGRMFNELYVSTLLPPSFRLAQTVPPATLLQDVKATRAELDQLAKEGSGADGADMFDAD
jgi:hypothetical protein